MAAHQKEEIYRATETGVAIDEGLEEDDDVEKDAGSNVPN